MEHLTVIKRLTDERIAPVVTLGGSFWSAKQQVDRKRRGPHLKHGQPLLKGAAFKRHHHEDVGAGIPAGLAAVSPSKSCA